MPELIVCPVCENRQATSDQCEVCGKKFSEAAEALLPIETMEALEPTSQDGAPTVEVESVAGLEPTSHPPAEAGEEAALEVERTHLEAVAVDSEVVPDLEPTSADPLVWEDRTPVLLAPLCRYCRTPAIPGEVICSRCGMQLPLVRPGAEAPSADSLRRCPGCGTPTLQDVCPGCGGRMPVSSGSPLAK